MKASAKLPTASRSVDEREAKRQMLLTLSASEDFDGIVAAIAAHEASIQVGDDLWEAFQKIETRRGELIKQAGLQLQRLTGSTDMLEICSVLQSSAAKHEINQPHWSTLDEHYLELAEEARAEFDDANQAGPDGTPNPNRVKAVLSKCLPRAISPIIM